METDEGKEIFVNKFLRISGTEISLEDILEKTQKTLCLLIDLEQLLQISKENFFSEKVKLFG